MEAITRLVSESLARHGFDRPLDYRRLHWSRWFRCESTHSLLQVPSKPGVFALAEEIMDLAPGTGHVGTAPGQVGADALVRPAERSAAQPVWDRVGACPEPIRGNPVKPSAARQSPTTDAGSPVEERRFSAASSEQNIGALAPEGVLRRMLAVTQFFEDDDMAFVLDRMLIRERSRLASGRYFVRFVVIEDESQRRAICTALNQWIANQSIANSAERASGIGSHFATSLELTPATEYNANDAQATLFDDVHMGRTLLSATADSNDNHVGVDALVRPAEQRSAVVGATASSGPSISIVTAPHLDSGAAANIHCPSPFPSGF